MGSGLLSADILPNADFEETEDSFVFEIDLPGVKKDDITSN